jgi:diadenylate cyclase
MSENSDAIVIVVSEETGMISIAIDGVLTREYTHEKLKTLLTNELIENPIETAIATKVSSAPSKLKRRKKK